jgi:2-polyprenyl-6-methoxyphenol hydroxylase-like FAD-dependent oxidoreductase
MTEKTTAVVAGGGPAGMMLGLLLARAGVEVSVLEKHEDFLRDFRGDTVHAATIRLLDELGLGEGFRKLPQSKLGNLEMPAPDGGTVVLGDFGTLSEPYNYVAMCPQWDFLNFLADAAQQEPTFTLRMNTEVTGLVRDGDRVSGVTYRTKDGTEGVIRADLTIACDGRHSLLRRLAGLRPREYWVPFDAWWFRLPRFAGEEGEIATLIPKFRGNEMLLTFIREDYYQIMYVTEKGADARLRAEGVERFRERVAGLRPDFADRVDAIRSMDDVHVLSVRLNRLDRWYTDGLLFIGDAAHTMSPAGGMGINLAVQDAVAAATILAGPLLRRSVTRADLAAVQRRRQMPTIVVQTAQRFLQRIMFAPAFAGKRSGPPKAAVFLGRRIPKFREVPARMIAFGPRSEHAPDFARR